MSRHLRNDPICQNCGDHVEKRFCSNCGQENTETRQSFGHLLRHFIEDLTHYDGNFWRTIRYLVFRPAYLTKEFLSGKRVAYVPPVRLYIFISFFTFLLIYLLPEPAETQEDIDWRIAHTDTTRLSPEQLKFDFVNRTLDIPRMYTSVSQMDSVQKTLAASERMSGFSRWFQKKYIYMQKYSKEELGERFFDSFGHNIPKGLIIYLPLFALILWLFHDKKRWMYYDHAIFTLHYFSFLLLIINFTAIYDIVCLFVSSNLHVLLADITVALLFLGIVIYFFVAHQRTYVSKGFLSFLKAVFIYFINFCVFAAVLVVLAFVTLFTIH